MARTLHLCFGVHNHQPVGNFEAVVADATARAYRPFLELVRRRSELRLTVHTTGNLLEWLRANSSDTFDVLGEVVARGQVELLTGGFYEPVLAILPDADKLGQIDRLTTFLKSAFGVRPRGMWLAERVWEPHLPRVLREAGVEYVLVDDTHFALAGLDPEQVSGYYLTEEQGNTLAVFPISQRLRYLVPFADVQESLDYLAERRNQVDALTVVDDGEKFGAWPGTFEHVYRDGWLDRFFDAVLRAPGVALTTFADVLDRFPPTDRVYLPTASYREMGEWALPPAAARELEQAKDRIGALPEGRRMQPLLRGGFWRSFLVKYPEVADTYWKMLRLSAAVHQALAGRPDDRRLLEARDALWRGQANDAYWHGVFGGCYLPHLRRAVKQSLLLCERRLAEGARDTPAWQRGDVNGDGHDEIVVWTEELVVTVNPARGGSVTELAARRRDLDVADVLTRRFELYHHRLREEAGKAPAVSGAAAAAETGLERYLEYDDLRRASLADGWFPGDQPLDPVAPWRDAELVLAGVALTADVTAEGGVVTVAMAGPADAPVRVEKRLRIGPRTVEVRYRLGSVQGRRLRGRWATQWNLVLTGPDPPERYIDVPDRPALRSTGRRPGASDVTLVDEWIGVELNLAWQPDAELAWGPVETVSVSEQGFERLYQGTALLLSWPLGDADEAELAVTLTLSMRDEG